jgi:hypothetical protein
MVWWSRHTLHLHSDTVGCLTEPGDTPDRHNTDSWVCVVLKPQQVLRAIVHTATAMRAMQSTLRRHGLAGNLASPRAGEGQQATQQGLLGPGLV